MSWQLLALVQSVNIYARRSDVKCRKPGPLKIHLRVYVDENKTDECPCTFMWLCVSFVRLIPSPPGASQPVGAQSDCGGRELVRAVALGDANMAMLSWHRS